MIRSKCDWYEHGEKSTKFFLNLAKKRGNQNQICKLIIDEKEIDGDVEILKKIESFDKTIFKSQSFTNVSEIEIFMWYYYSVSQQRSNKSLRKRLV